MINTKRKAKTEREREREREREINRYKKKKKEEESEMRKDSTDVQSSVKSYDSKRVKSKLSDEHYECIYN